MKRLSAALLGGAMVVGALTGCGSDAGGENVVKVVYLNFGGGDPTDQWLNRAAEQFERANEGVDVQLEPITGSVDDYYTRLALMQRSQSTAPDVLLEDSSNINSDVQAKYLKPLDDYLASWSDWDQFVDAAKTATRAQDGRTYGVLMASDTRALWYNKQLFDRAGLDVPWEPKTWEDVLTAASTVKREIPDVTPVNIYASKAATEHTVMQGFQMLLYGTGGTLYDEEARLWVLSGQEFEDSLALYDAVFSAELGPSPQVALSAQLPNQVSESMLPKGELAIALDGSWLPRAWLDSGSNPWPEWSEVLGIAPMPTQYGQPPGEVSMSGGFSLAISDKANNPDGGWKFIQTALNKDNTQWVNTTGNLTTVREDVAASPDYADSNPSVKPLTDLMANTHFRPTLPEYPQVSALLQIAVESVATGEASPADALEQFTSAATDLVGAENVKKT